MKNWQNQIREYRKITKLEVRDSKYETRRKIKNWQIRSMKGWGSEQFNDINLLNNILDMQK